jgi:enterochelin esterase-like enzyme
MNLTGWSFPAALAAASAAAFVALVIWWPRLSGNRPGLIAARAGMLLAVNVLVLITAFAMLNAQFLFYANWSDLTGSVTATSRATTLQRGGSVAQAVAGRVEGPAAVAGDALPPLPIHRADATGVISYSVAGPLSGLSGQVMVQLPPGYTDPAQAAQRYPVLETFPGYPGQPAQWIRPMHLGTVMNQEVAAHRLRPALIVSAQVAFPRGADAECVNGVKGEPQVETWLTQDVPNWITHTFRVRTDRADWTTIGLSTGGWCAAMATILHPAQYSAAIVMGGYFRPDFGPIGEPYPPGSPLARRYDLVAKVRAAAPPTAIWLETSHADPLSYGSSAALLKAARRPLAVTAVVLQHAGHRISLWQSLLPQSLTWLGANVPGFRPETSQSAATGVSAATDSRQTARNASPRASAR